MKIYLIPECKNCKFSFKRRCEVEVCQFRFEFYSISFLEEVINYFSTKTHPMRRRKHWDSHHEQVWYCALPQYLIDNHHRLKVLKALRAALVEWKAYNDRHRL